MNHKRRTGFEIDRAAGKSPVACRGVTFTPRQYWMITRMMQGPHTSRWQALVATLAYTWRYVRHRGFTVES